MEVSGHCHNMAILPLGKESSVTIVYVVEWAIGPVWMLQRGKVSLALARNLAMIVGCPTCSFVTIPIISPCPAGWCYLLFLIITEKFFWHVHTILKNNCLLHHVCLHRTTWLLLDGFS